MPSDQYRFESAWLFGASEPLLEAIEIAGVCIWQTRSDYFVTLVRNQLDEITFANASAEGRVTGMKQTIDYVLQLLTNL